MSRPGYLMRWPMTKCVEGGIDMGVDFVQIGAAAIRLDKITCVQFEPEPLQGEPRVWIHFVGGPGPGHQAHTLNGAAAIAFKNWWDLHASVYIIEDEEMG